MPGLQRLKKKPCHPGKLWEIARFVLILNPDWSYRVDLVIKGERREENVVGLILLQTKKTNN